jgi:hypothetical protein
LASDKSSFITGVGLNVDGGAIVMFWGFELSVTLACLRVYFRGVLSSEWGANFFQYSLA